MAEECKPSLRLGCRDGIGDVCLQLQGWLWSMKCPVSAGLHWSTSGGGTTHSHLQDLFGLSPPDQVFPAWGHRLHFGLYLKILLFG